MASSAISAVTPRTFQPLLWWHLLSLDAPTIAVLWCALFSKTLGVPLARTGMVALAFGVWWLYVLDRLLDGYDATAADQMLERHYFYARHRKIFVPLLAVSGVAGAAVLIRVGPILLPAARHDFFALGFFLIVYYLLIHALRKHTHWFPKEFAVGVFFCCAVAVPAWVRLPVHIRLNMLMPVVALGLLCWLNCVAITRWEARAASQPHTRTVWSLAAACVVLSTVGIAYQRTPVFFAATLLSTAALAWLELNRARFSATWMRVAADCALLTPLLMVPVLYR